MGAFHKFWQTFFYALNPGRYDKLSKNIGHAFFYYAAMLFVVFLATGLLFIPTLFSLPDRVNQELQKFETLEMSFNYTLKEPILLPHRNPVLVIDTVDNPDPIQEGTVIVSGDSFYFQPFPYADRLVIRNNDNILHKPAETAALASMLILYGAPVVFIVGYVYHFIKYLIVIFVASFACFVLARVARFSIDYHSMFIVSMYASTVMACLSLITKPFTPSIGYLEYIVFAVYLLLGTLTVGDFADTSAAQNHPAAKSSRPPHQRTFDDDDEDEKAFGSFFKKR
ncbi:DUF1189 family protein [Candidatus Woesearchaeota archaeon]|nr:DUF1189 family protein [Candidatus Woesearchaeota archaeon]